MEARKHKPKKPKPPFLNYKRRYDPSESGYGDPEQWRNAFGQRMGFEEAQAFIDKDDPHTILGINKAAVWLEIKQAFRAAALRYHPDRAAHNNMTVDEATEKFKRINAAYTVLEKRYGKA
jgi:DnaJ-class molecular chaperone